MNSLLPIQGDVIFNDKTWRISWMFTDFENVIVQLTCLIALSWPLLIYEKLSGVGVSQRHWG